jgi:hypothetical protein
VVFETGTSGFSLTTLKVRLHASSKSPLASPLDRPLCNLSSERSTLTTVNFVTMGGMISFLCALYTCCSMWGYCYSLIIVPRAKRFDPLACVFMMATISLFTRDTATAARAYTALYRVFLGSYVYHHDDSDLCHVYHPVEYQTVVRVSLSLAHVR